jgi:hypothetical protein
MRVTASAPEIRGFAGVGTGPWIALAMAPPGRMAACFATGLRFRMEREGSMTHRERRQPLTRPNAALRAQLNEEQLMTLRELERFGWELKFVRRPPFQDLVPIVIDGDRKSFSILKTDGTLEDNPGIPLRA